MKKMCRLTTTLYVQKKKGDLTRAAEMLADKVLENPTTKTDSDEDKNEEMYINIVVNFSVNT